MTDDTPPDRRAAFRAVIERFIQDRLDAKLDKLPDDDPKRSELAAQYSPPAWLADAARRVEQIQAVTHSLKPIHPDARGSNLYCAPGSLPAHVEVGSHCLSADFAVDVVGNAAALDVYKFLRLKLGEQTLLDAMLVNDADLAAALNDDPTQAAEWIEAFSGLVQPRGGAATHTLGKQLYWLSGADPLTDVDFTLLAPLYASSLAHQVFQRINEDRFGEAAKAARQARREERDHPHGYAEYPNLAVQKLGGTKPQNISQLNSERGGNNYLLGSLPPQWKSQAIRPLWRIKSAFPVFGRRKEVREEVLALRRFLESGPIPNLETDLQRDAFLVALIDELVAFANAVQDELTPGWSAKPECELREAEKLWLDPFRAKDDDAFRQQWQFMDWPAEIGQGFGLWLNAQLDTKLPVGLIESRQWAKELLLDEEWAGRLHTLRKRLEAPTYIPTQKGGDA